MALLILLGVAVGLAIGIAASAFDIRARLGQLSARIRRLRQHESLGSTNQPMMLTRIGVAVLLLFSVVDIAARQRALAIDREYQQLAREIFQELIAIKTTESGVGATPAAEALARRLRAAGFAESDVQVIGPSERKKNLVARLRGAAAPPVMSRFSSWPISMSSRRVPRTGPLASIHSL